MNNLKQKNDNKTRRKIRIKKRIHGSSVRPRLSIFISNSNISAQIINDDKGQTLVAATTVNSKQKGSLSEKAVWLGEQIANKALKAKINKVVFDRNGKLYHGRIKAVADSARKAGLEF